MIDEDQYMKGLKVSMYQSLLSCSDIYGIPISMQKQILYKILESADLKVNEEELNYIGKFYKDKEIVCPHCESEFHTKLVKRKPQLKRSR